MTYDPFHSGHADDCLSSALKRRFGSQTWSRIVLNSCPISFSPEPQPWSSRFHLNTVDEINPACPTIRNTPYFP